MRHVRIKHSQALQEQNEVLRHTKTEDINEETLPESQQMKNDCCSQHGSSDCQENPASESQDLEGSFSGSIEFSNVESIVFDFSSPAVSQVKNVIEYGLDFTPRIVPAGF